MSASSLFTETATLVKKLPNNPIHKGNSRSALYKLSVPLDGWDYVVVSSVNNMLATCLVYETYIFGADSDGSIQNWGELPGSERGHTSHTRALNNAGYSVVRDNEE